jgi:cytochrome c oxidase subunit 1
LNQLATAGAYLLGIGVVIWIYNVVQSLRVGPVVTDADVWDLKSIDQFTREWQWFEERLAEREARADGGESIEAAGGESQ